MFEKLPNDASYRAILELAMMHNLTFPREVELDCVAFHPNVSGSQRRQAVAAILTGINLAASSKEAGREDAQDTRHHPLSAQVPLSQMFRHDFSHPRNRLSELQHAIKLLLIAPLDMTRVIEILPSARGILPDYLKHSTRRRIDRNVRPGWRNNK
jgi:hypothetical protein